MNGPDALAEFVPVGVDDSGRVVLRSLGPLPFAAPFFDLTVTAGPASPRLRLTLDELSELQPPVELPALIVHSGRCGSTLLCRLLDTTGCVATFREPDVVHAAMSHDPDLGLAVLRQFSWAAVTSGRRPVVKLPSHDVDLCRTLGVPTLAVVRGHDSVVASAVADPPAWALDPGGGVPGDGALATKVSRVWTRVAETVLELDLAAVGYGDLRTDPVGSVARAIESLSTSDGPTPQLDAIVLTAVTRIDAKRGGAFRQRVRPLRPAVADDPRLVDELERRLGERVRLG
ncbi:MAG: hypothetical protein ACOYOQ_16290 [Microthrixaceae bacterium]